jgi:hypothetical protein
LLINEILTTASGDAVGYVQMGGGTIDLRTTSLGDSDLDGRVNVADLANLAGNFGVTTGATLINGDFDYNGTVNVADLADLAGNFGAFMPGASAPSVSAVASIAVVPEPAMCVTLATACWGATLRRRIRFGRGSESGVRSLGQFWGKTTSGNSSAVSSRPVGSQSIKHGIRRSNLQLFIAGRWVGPGSGPRAPMGAR